MSFFKQLSSNNTKPQLPKPTQSFSLMKMFKKPTPAVVIQEPKVEKEHRYIQDFKRLDEEKKKKTEEKLNEARVPPEIRKLREKLEKEKKNFIRVDKGVESKYKQTNRGSGMVQVVDVSFGASGKDKEKEKEKQREKLKEKERQREKERQKTKEQSRPVQKSRPKQDKYKDTYKQSRPSYPQKDRERQRDRQRQRQRQRQREKPRGRQSDNLKKSIRQTSSKPVQAPPLRKKIKKHHYYSDQQDSMGSFLESDEDGTNALQVARKMYGKYYNDEYTRRDREVIRESTFDELAREEKVSKAYAMKDEMQDMELEMRRKEERRKRREREERERDRR